MAKPIKRRSGCRSFFVFLLGMITGVVVFLGSIAGTIYVVISSWSLRDVENNFHIDIPLGDNEIMDMTLLALGTDLFNTIKNINEVSLQNLIDKYGLPLPGNLAGIDISQLFDYPLGEMSNHFSEVFDSMTLSTVADFTGIDFTSYNLPVLTNNLDKPVVEAFDAILGSFGGAMSMRSLEANFGIDLTGSSAMLSKFIDIPLDSLGSAIDYLTLGELIDIDIDLYIETGATSLFVKTERFDTVTNPTVEIDGSQRYISDVDESGLVYKEMRYVRNEDDSFTVDNGDYDSNTIYYRYFEYEPYNSAIHTSATEFFVKAYADKFDLNNTTYQPRESGYYKLNDLFIDNLGTPLSDFSTITSGTTFYLYDDLSATYTAVDEFGIDGIADENSSFDNSFDGWLLVHEGESDAPMQVLSFSTIKTLDTVTDDILRLPLGELINIDTSPTSLDPKILRTLAGIPVSQMSATMSALTLSDAIDIDTSAESTDPKILQSLADAVITNLSAEINALVLGDAINIDETTHIVLQRLAYVGINDIASQMTVVINELALKELISIQQYSVYNLVDSSSNILLTRFDDTVNYLFVVDSTGNYYYNGSAFTPLDTTYHADSASYTRYKKHFFEELLTHDAGGAYVLIDGFATVYDSENLTHQTLDRFNLVHGFIAKSSEVMSDINGHNYVLNESTNNVVEDASAHYVNIDLNFVKSSQMLISLGNQQVQNMGVSFSSMTMGQIVTIEADSFFDDDAIRNSTPDNLSSAIATRLYNSTIGQLATWGELTLNPAVLSILQNITVSEFFSNLAFDVESGNIVYVP